ncbi:MAG: hypothetical protein AAF533_00380 [Acidobacteriota bacterium]
MNATETEGARETVETASCRYCRREVHSKAARCPHCYSFLDGSDPFIPRSWGWLRWMMALLLVMMTLLVAVMFREVATSDPSGEHLADLGQVSIEETRLELVERDGRHDGPRVVLTGWLVNDGGLDIWSATFQVTLHDAEGGLIDRFEEGEFWSETEAQARLPFRLVEPLSAKPEQYDHHRVRVSVVRLGSELMGSRGRR